MTTTQQVTALLGLIPAGTVAERWAREYVRRYGARCWEILGSGANADGKALLKNEANELLLTQLSNLVDPLFDPGEPPAEPAEPEFDE